MNEPTVSVIMSVFNGVESVGAAIESVLAQSFSAFEFVIVDDGSSDGTDDVLRKFAARDSRIKIAWHENRGLGPSLARGCEMARAKLLARQDADDVSRVTRLARQVRFMKENEDCVVCGAWTRLVCVDAGPQFTVCLPDRSALLKRLLFRGRNPFFHGSTMFRREPYERCAYRIRDTVEDLDVWLRMAALGKFGMVESVEYEYVSSASGLNACGRDVEHSMAGLVFGLHRERARFGREVTDWRKAEQELRAARSFFPSPCDRVATAKFELGSILLRRRRYEDALAAFAEAAAVDGQNRRKAVWLARTANLPGIVRFALLCALRWMLRIRNKSGVERYTRYEP